MSKPGKYISPVYEEILKEQEARKQEKNKKMKKMFNNIIQSNIKERETERLCNVSDSSDEVKEMEQGVSRVGTEIEESKRDSEGLDDLVVPRDDEVKPVVTNEGEFYEVEKILDKKIIDGEVHYLTKWKNLPTDESTWEPTQNLIYVSHLVDDFNIQFSKLMKQKFLKPTGHKKANKKRTKEGNYEYGDVADKIVNVKRDKEQLIFTIEWKPRENHSIPLQSEYTNKDLRKYDPHLLLEFYESKLKLVQ